MSRHAVHVFVGPTLAPEDVATILPDARLHPPIAAGDLLALQLRPGDVVAIIDGYFRQQRSVRHKEILAVVDDGAIVAGAASMGALRAAELWQFGMRGVGQVFAWYRTGAIVGDDEVAVLHLPPENGYTATTHALVNIRATLRAAVADGRCDAATADGVIRALQPMPYLERDTEGLRTRVVNDVGSAAADTLVHCLTEHAVDVKAADARSLLRAVAADALPPAARLAHHPHVAASDVRRTSTHLAWRVADATVPGRPQIPLGLALACASNLARDYPRHHRAVAVAAAMRDAQRSAPKHRGPIPAPRNPVPATPVLSAAGRHPAGPGEVPAPPPGAALDDRTAETLLDLLASRGLPVAGDGLPAVLAPFLTATEQAELPLGEQLQAFLARTYTPAWLQCAVIEALGERLERWYGVAARVHRLNIEITDRRPQFSFQAIPPDAVRALFARRWLPDGQPPQGRAWDLALADRGYLSEQAWLPWARQVYPFALLRADRHADLDEF